MFDEEELRQVSSIDDKDWTLGSRQAPITLLEYGDFECPYCGMARSELESLVVGHADSFRLVFRHFPLSSIHPHALSAAEAAEAAGAQGQFWEMHDLLFAHQRQLAYEHLHRYARALSLDIPRFEQDLAAHVHLASVRRDARMGIDDGVNGTPSIFINGWRYDGPRERDAILATIAERLPDAVREHGVRLLDSKG